MSMVDREVSEERGPVSSCEGMVVGKSALVSVERHRGYGSVPGLEDEELADPAELERQVFAQEWGPILALPCRSRRGGIRPAIDEWGHLDWGAFGTWDFERLRGPFDAARYKADKLQEQLRNDLFMLDTVRERLSPEAREQVRTQASRPEVDLDDFADADQRAYAKWLRRVRRLSQEIYELREFSRRRRRGPALSAA